MRYGGHARAAMPADSAWMEAADCEIPDVTSSLPPGGVALHAKGLLSLRPGRCRRRRRRRPLPLCRPHARVTHATTSTPSSSVSISVASCRPSMGCSFTSARRCCRLATCGTWGGGPVSECECAAATGARRRTLAAAERAVGRTPDPVRPRVWAASGAAAGAAEGAARRRREGRAAVAGGAARPGGCLAPRLRLSPAPAVEAPGLHATWS
jgi:hypothetical protein